MTVSKKFASVHARGHVDIIDLSYGKNEAIISSSTPRNNDKLLLVYEDLESRFIVLEAMLSDGATETAKHLLDIFAIIGAPRVLQSSRGRDFTRQVVEELHSLWPSISLLHGDREELDCDGGGSAEKKRDFRKLIDDWLIDNPGKSWLEGLKIVQAIENSTPRSPGQKSPFELLFAKKGNEEQQQQREANLPDNDATAGLFLSFDADGILKSLGNPVIDDNSTSSGCGISAINATPINDDDFALEGINGYNHHRNHYNRELQSLDRTTFNLNKSINEFEPDFCSLDDKNISLIIESSLKEYFSTFNEKEEETAVTAAKTTIIDDGTSLPALEAAVVPIDIDPNDNDDNSGLYEQLKRDQYSRNEELLAFPDLNECTKPNFVVVDDNSSSPAAAAAAATVVVDFAGCINKPLPSSSSFSFSVVPPETFFIEQQTNPRRRRCIDRGNNNNPPPAPPKTVKGSTTKTKKPKARGVNGSSSSSSSRLHECRYCNQAFAYASVLTRHLRSHTNERPYTCTICKRSFKQPGHLSQHRITHTEYRASRCCGTQFESLEALKLHVASEHLTIKRAEVVDGDGDGDNDTSPTVLVCKLFECDACKRVFASKAVLKRHVAKHSEERLFGCGLCDKRFKQMGHLKAHTLGVHSDEKRFACQICDRRFGFAVSLKKHMYVHGRQKPYRCDECGARFAEKRNLRGHVVGHTNYKPYICEQCGKGYTLEDTLRRHVLSVHVSGRSYQCEICSKLFKQLAHLEVHKKVHSNERPYRCGLCDKSFNYKNVLKGHLALHTNHRPYECRLCQASFIRKTNLETHYLTAHTDERPYGCQVCGKKFKQAGHLNGHVNSCHLKLLPFQCKVCGRRCSRLDNLKKHVELHERDRQRATGAER